MGVTINVNGLSLVHKGSGGVAISTPPDVCKTPPTPVPVPYVNVAFSSTLAKGTKTIKVDGGNSAAINGSEFSTSIGDEPGVGGGVKSGVNMKEATWLSWSPNVKMEGKAACRLTDKMHMNHMNTVCLAGVIQQFIPSDQVSASPDSFTPDPARGVERAARAHEASKAAKRRGEVPTQSTSDLDELYEQAAVANEELTTMTDEVAAQTGGRPFRPTREDGTPMDSVPLKGRARAEAKVDQDYGGEASYILDLSRSTIIFDTVEAMYRGFDQIAQQYELVRVKDRYHEPGPEGYRDILMNVRMSNGHVVEMQLHTQAIIDVKQGPGHDLYEQQQELRRGAQREGRPMTPEEQAADQSLTESQREVYDAAFVRAGGTLE